MSTISQLEAIRTQLAELAEQVERLTTCGFVMRMSYDAGYRNGEADTQAALYGRAAETSRTTRQRATRHLRVVGDDTA
jgi:hypothetical protein